MQIGKKEIFFKCITLVLLLTLVAGVVALGILYQKKPKDDPTIKVMSYNIRCFALDDLGVKSWGNRSKYVKEVIKSNDPDIIGFQEVMQIHEQFLKEELTEYSFHTAYREKSLFQEGVMIAYKTEKFTLEQEGMFWLSNTPEKQSKDWDSSFPRVANYVVLTEKATGKKITFFDTHLDNNGDIAREKQLEVILSKLDGIAEGCVFLVGDMNDFDDSSMYKKATEKLTDAMTVAKNVSVGTGATYQAYGTKLDHKRIDYCFVTNGTEILDFKVDDTTFNGIYPSDHFPIIVKAAL